MFRASICPSSGVHVCYCIWCSALGVAAVIPRGWRVVLCTVCKILHTVVLCTVCKILHTVHRTTRQPLGITAATPSAEHHMQVNRPCAPGDGHIDARNM